MYGSGNSPQMGESRKMKLVKATQEDINALKNDSLDVEVGLLPELRLGDISYSCFVGDALVGCGGLIIFWPGVAEAWLMLSKKCNFMSNIERAKVVLLIRKKMEELIKEHKLWRIGAIIRPDFPQAIRLATVLGFKREGLLKKYAPDGTDRLIFGRT